MKYQSKKEKLNSKSGFTLIELLGVIVVLVLIATITLRIINVTKDDVDDKIDKTTKNMILSAASDYTLEFRNTSDWKEEKTSDGTTIFCISFDSLVEKGYFKNSKTNYQEISDGYYAVKGTIKNNVYNYEFIELDDNISDDDICKYYRRESNIYSNPSSEETIPVDKIEINSNIQDGDNTLGTLDYKIQNLKNNKYAIKLDLDLNLYDILETKDIYVNVVLDKSGSMNSSNKYKNAKTAASSFSKILSETDGINAKMSLIEFGLQPMLKRDFSTEPFANTDFSSPNGGGTNASGGIDLVTSFIADGVIKKGSDTYTILLFDGQPIQYSTIDYYDKDGKKTTMSPQYIYNKLENPNYDIHGYAAIYYKNFHNAITGCGDNARCKEYEIINDEGLKEKIQITYGTNGNSWNHLTTSSNYLKNTGSKLIVIGYGTDFGKNAQNIATTDSELCSDSKYSSSCYYYNATGDDISELFNNLANNIIKYSEANKIILSLEPTLKDGHQLINIYDTETKKLDKIEKIIDLEQEDTLKQLESNNGALQISDEYKFVISNYLYDSMNCTGEKCTSNNSVQLFNLTITLMYPNGSEKTIDIEQPFFNFGIYKESTLN